MYKNQTKSYPKSDMVLFHAAPDYMQFNCYIKTGYRNEISVSRCFLSIFQWSNETINIWSHLLGFLIFMYLFFHDWIVVYEEYQPSLLDTFVASFVLCCFMVCMLFSTLYHALNCHSHEYCRLWLSRDIFGISIAFLGVFISGIYYGFWCDQHIHLRYFYGGFVCILFAMAMCFVLLPRFTTDEWSFIRLCLFFLWAVSGILPTIHFASLFVGVDTAAVELFLPRIFNMYALCGGAVVVYLFKIPEYFFPGKFDYIGASHQLWHVIIFVALFYWHQTGIMYAQYRQRFGCRLQ